MVCGLTQQYDVACVICKRVKTLELNVDAMKEWQNGKLIQDAFPNLSEDDRELMISGTCGECFDAMMEAYDEDDTEG